VWNGEHCIAVVPEWCACEGADCGAMYATIADCVAARRECYDVDCAAQPVADPGCIDCTAEVFLGAFWDGRECFELHGCECRGEACAGAFESLEECRAVQAGCDGALCRATGGQWFRAWGGVACGFHCGVPNPDACFVPFDSCNCGPGREFERGTGCVDAACDPARLCWGSGGTWHPASDCFCGFHCGRPGDCEACLDSCDCGLYRNFDPSAGCLPDRTCAGTDTAAVCTSTGGTWHDCGPSDPGCTCGNYTCGSPFSFLPCLAPGCDCGTSRNFDDARGCVFVETCTFRQPGESCIGHGDSSSCRPGLACCPSFCGPPCCPDHPSCGEDGCPI
jgi:hypothetical protein